ncbi:muconolactone Delta-isomerase [Prescottella defluvii]|uniref:muconolactone Delta-isomerase n=1 Tax=Prescottella defluvii TaxID=1323361 RepID=UPI0004F24DF1|nr:muconolactone Delta-isomerase [Prescottella defluvii]
MALFHVRMDVDIPHDLDPVMRAETLAREKAYSQELQRQGKWAHLWRIVGRYSNISIFDVDSADELHEILWNLPLFPYMTVEVMPMTEHGSSIR